MLRFGKLTDYSAAIMCYLYMPDKNHATSAKDIAENLHISLPTVSKILKMLNKSGLVNSIRGASGGYALNKVADKITLLEIIEAMEGKFGIVSCSANPSCLHDKNCIMKPHWQSINTILVQMMQQITLADINNKRGLPKNEQ